jgi:hypothetical protein
LKGKTVTEPWADAVARKNWPEAQAIKDRVFADIRKTMQQQHTQELADCLAETKGRKEDQ